MTSSFQELGAFLRRARANVQPVGSLLADGRVRRVPGLRREEVALLAGVSTDYYTRLEQGRRIVPSAQVVAALAAALQLDDASREHVRHLVAASEAPVAAPRTSVQRVRKGLWQLLEALGDHPVLVLGYDASVLASTRLARALFADFDAMAPKERNYARWLLLDPAARSLFVDWELQARTAVETLRFAAGNHPHDRGLQALVGELMVGSAEFAAWWAQHQVQQRTYGTKQVVHPVIGELAVEYESFLLPGDRDQTVYVYTTAPDSASREAMSLLGHWTAPKRVKCTKPAALDPVVPDLVDGAPDSAG
ncbi:helix-turn-helix domain-containing protein [Frondihabitans sp. VKM Ac-2883]|uniref:helix-turn-helix domain-containing protein n=1 Tax=Frondihabitans sp. VKM Ac-2883 TaxID=2783823 RepID=UPI00351C15D4